MGGSVLRLAACGATARGKFRPSVKDGPRMAKLALRSDVRPNKKAMTLRGVDFLPAASSRLTSLSNIVQIRALWYLMHVANEDSTVRRRGIVFILYPATSAWTQFDPTLYRSMMALGNSFMALVARSIHLCQPSPMFHVANPILKLLFGGRLRKRLRVHYGSTEDVLRSLSEFGLTKDGLPSELGGNLCLNQVKWLSERMVSESMHYRYSPSPPAANTDGGIEWAKSAAQPSLDRQQSSGALSSADGSGCATHDLADAELDNLESIILSMDDELNGLSSTDLTTATRPLLAPVHGLYSQGPLKEVEHVMTTKRYQERQSRPGEPLNGKNPGLEQTSTHVVVSTNRAAVSSKSQTNRSMHNATTSFSQALTQCNAESFDSVTDSIVRNEVSLINAKAGVTGGRKKAGVPSIKGDLRMMRAIEARLADPHMSLFDALIAGGFDFPAKREKGVGDKDIKDNENVSLYQRKNQLSRRLRERRREDPRMYRAVAAIRENPQLSLVDALVQGGFKFSQKDLALPDLCDRNVRDAENVTLYSRKNGLKNRLIDLGVLHPAASVHNMIGSLRSVNEPHQSQSQNAAVRTTDYSPQKQMSLSHTSRGREAPHEATNVVIDCRK